MLNVIKNQYDKRPYKFSLQLALLLSLYNVIIIWVFASVFSQRIIIESLVYLMLVFSIGAFFIIRFRVEKYIYNKIKVIHEAVSILDVNNVNEKITTSDVENLEKQVLKFADAKRVEIESLQAQEHFRREFIGNLAHELKTPLFTVQGYVETLLDGAMEDPVILQRYLQRADKGVDRLINITKDLDLMTKMETDNLFLDKSVFAIDELTENITDLLEIKLQSKNIKVKLSKHIEGGVMVYADKEKISQVLMNLISNAIKYGKENGVINIQFRENKNKMFTYVKDNGEGIKTIHLKRVFERFYRVDRHRSRAEGGSGLGLAIVKHILEAHDEKILVESQYSVGSNFYFSLPLG
ncbi:MAG: ATP-binding protein [Ichthyobacteriaceae bacterium]|nr:ATP-binding protein [Ichthyobacteriaceae bacterium]